MKKNSFKRFLAVTLAAATALTFAPVSTLGLSGVIEAQAAATQLATGALKDGEEYTAPDAAVDVTASVEAGETLKITLDTAAPVTKGDLKVTDNEDRELYTVKTYPEGGNSKHTIVEITGINDGDANKAIYKSGTDWKIASFIDSLTVTVTKQISESKNLKLDDAAGNDEYVANDNTDQMVLDFAADGDIAESDIITKFLDKDGKELSATDEAKITTNLTSIGKTKAKVTVRANAAKAGKYTIKVNTRHKGDAGVTKDFYVTTAPSTAIKAEAANITLNAGESEDVEVTFTGDKDYDSFDTQIAKSAAVSTDISATPVGYISSHKGTVTIKANADASGEYTVYIGTNNKDKAIDVDGGTNAIGHFTVTVNAADLAFTKTSNIKAGGDAGIFKIQTPGTNDVYKVAILDSTGKDVTTDFDLYTVGADGKVTNTRLKNTGATTDTVGAQATSNEASFGVKAGASVKGGTYTVKVIDATETAIAVKEISTTKPFTVTPSGNVNPQPEEENNVFTYGGVLNSIYAYKGASYDLVEHAAIKYNGVNYSGSELEWYLVDASNAPAYGEARQDLKSINLPTDAGTVENGKAGSLKVTVSDSDKFVYSVSGETKIVAEALVKGVRTVVYVGGDFTAIPVDYNVVKSVINVSVNVQASGIQPEEKDVLDTKIANPTKDNIYLKAKEVAFPVDDLGFVETDAHYALTPILATGDNNPFKGSKLTLTNGNKLPTGTYYETEYIPFKVNGNATDTDTLYLLKVNTTVSVNTGVNFRVKDGESILATTFGNDKAVTDPVVYLNLTDAKTWNIKDHIQADVDLKDKDLSFSFDSDSANADVDSNGVITAKSVGNANITIKASYKGLESKTTLMVRVNQYGFDTVSVKGEDGTNAKVLSPRDYNNNSVSVVKVERNLVTRQIPYVQIFVTGNETSNVNYTPVVASANGAKLSYEFVEDYASKGLTIDPTTGKITIDYTKCTNNNYTALGVYGVKVVSADTNKSVATTSYYYVVVDFPDKTISGLEDNYTVGTCTSHLHNDDPAVALYTESAGTATSFDWVYKNTEDFVGDSHYKDDDISAFTTDTFATTGKICKAIVTDKTMHVLAYNAQSITNRTGYTAKLITVKSAPAVENYVDKIVNKETGEVLYDHSVNAGDTARELKIDKATTIQVSLKYPVASVASGSAVHLNIAMNNQTSGKIVNQTPYVTAVENSKEVDVALYPNSKGTTVITVSPAGHLTATDRTDIHKSPVNVAVTYTGEAANGAKNPAQVKGVKVSNKKGAKVTVKFNKITANSTMRYYVQKKVGKKVSGKSIGSTKTTLSVKKGATVKVRVKAYYYDANGVKHVGKYSSWKTLKTDKK